MSKVLFQTLTGFQCFVFGAMLLFQMAAHLGVPYFPRTAFPLYLLLGFGLCLLFWLWLFLTPRQPMKFWHCAVFLLGSFVSLFAAPFLCFTCTFRFCANCPLRGEQLLIVLAAGDINLFSFFAALVYFAMTLAVFATPISMFISWFCVAGSMVSIFEELDPSKKNDYISRPEIPKNHHPLEK